MSHAYKFAKHANVPETPPDTERTRLLERAFDPTAVLTRDEKDKLVFTSECEYKQAGWCWPMWHAPHLRRILVNYEFHGWQEYYAPDKTAVRKSLGHRVVEMIYAPRRKP